MLQATYDEGFRFCDTADAYGDDRSEQVIGTFLAADAHADIVRATKAGRQVMPQTAEIYTLDNLRAWTDRSRDKLGFETLDLVQLHCRPTSGSGSSRAGSCCYTRRCRTPRRMTSTTRSSTR